jgi:solute carrier family 25 phosphate transporter 3
LLHYDVSASAWWDDQADLYSLLPSNDAIRREGKSFGSYASSIQRGLYSYVSGDDGTNVRSYEKVREKYSALLTSLTEKYGSERGAIRDIALLFAMLPAVYQPTDMLLKISKTALTATGTNRGTNEDSFPPNYQTDFTLLLPNTYRAIYDPSTKSFVITPKINLFEIGIEEDIGSSSISTTFGPLSSKPLSRQRKLSLDVYALLGISGGLGCASTHTLVIPLDVVKTRLQTNPGRYDSVLDGAMKIAYDEGLDGLFLGMQATVVGYLWYGISVYPSYAFLKRYIGEELLSSAFALAHSNDVALVAGALASVIASLGLTPTEACRIRTVAQPDIYRDMGLLGTLRVIVSENYELGWKNLYAGLPSLMTRQVVFGSVKFLTFERASDAIFAHWPELRYRSYTALGVSLVAGGIAGVLSSIVSQPADSVLTYVAKRSSGGLGVLDGAKMMVREEGLGSLFRGLGSRSVWAGCIIAGQFLLYDVFRAYFGISGDDLTQVFELVVIPK